MGTAATAQGRMQRRAAAGQPSASFHDPELHRHVRPVATVTSSSTQTCQSMTGMRVLMADNRLCEAGPRGEEGLRLCHRALGAFGFRKGRSARDQRKRQQCAGHCERCFRFHVFLYSITTARIKPDEGKMERSIYSGLSVPLQSQAFRRVGGFPPSLNNNAKAAALNSAPVKKVAGAPRSSHMRPAARLANNRAMPLMRLKKP